MLADANGYDLAIAVVITAGSVLGVLIPLLVSIRRKTTKLETHANDAARSAQVATSTAAAATVSAASAASAAADIRSTLGKPNGNGNVTQMLERLLGESAESRAAQVEMQQWQAATDVWKSEHDGKDDSTRLDVEDIKRYLGMPKAE